MVGRKLPGLRSDKGEDNADGLCTRLAGVPVKDALVFGAVQGPRSPNRGGVKLSREGRCHKEKPRRSGASRRTQELSPEVGYASALILGRSRECGLHRNDHFIEKEESLDLLTAAKARIAKAVGELFYTDAITPSGLA